MSCWPSWPFAARPRFIAGRDLGSRPLVPNVGLVGFLLSATAASKGRERKARDVRCHKIASDPICLGLCTMEPNYFWAFCKYLNYYFLYLYVCTIPPQYLADQLTLLQPREGILFPPITTAPHPLDFFHLPTSDR